VSGPSGRGKSSLVAALGEHGYRVLAEDALALSSQAGRWQLWPGPTGVRLDARTASALGAEITDTQLIRGKQLHVPRLSPEDGAAADVAAVVRLEPRGGPGLTVEEIRGAEAMAAVFPSVFRIELDDVPRAFRQVGELVRQIPCFTARLPDDLGRLPEISLALLSRLGAVRPGIRAA
jgi:hypothetical protein